MEQVRVGSWPMGAAEEAGQGLAECLVFSWAGHDSPIIREKHSAAQRHWSGPADRPVLAFVPSPHAVP